MAVKRKPTVIYIGDNAYRVRVPTGCPSDDGTPSEWDMIMDTLGESNDLLHWSYIWSWCQESIYGNSFIESATKTIRLPPTEPLEAAGRPGR